MKFDYDLKYYNFMLLLFVIGLNICGIFIVKSAANMNDSIVTKQIIGTLTGICLCIVFSFIDYKKLVKYYGIIYLITILFLFAVLIWGATHKGAGRWIVLPFIGQIQPAEFSKVGIIVFFAGYFDKHKDDLNNLSVFFKSVILFAIPAVLIFAEPNLSTTIIVTVIFAAMIFAAGLSFKWIGGTILTIMPVLMAVLYTFTTDLYKKLPFIKDYQKDRILGLLYPERFPDIFLQQQNSIMAIGSGGLYGKGLYNSDISSVKAGNFLIEEETDFIFAIIGEELGFRGAVLILMAFLVIIFLILNIAGRTKETKGKVLCVGVAVWIGFQTFTNIAVSTALFPNTGVTLPFISRGVSSLLALYIAIGIVLNIGLQRKTYK